jgi:hypothetical protein
MRKGEWRQYLNGWFTITGGIMIEIKAGPEEGANNIIERRKRARNSAAVLDKMTRPRAAWQGEESLRETPRKSGDRRR